MFIYIVLKFKLNQLISNKINNKKCDITSIKNGDILLFKWFESRLVSYETIFTHIGIVIEMNNKLYVLENHEKWFIKFLKYTTVNINIYELNDRIKDFDGNVYLLRLKKNLNENNKILINKNLTFYLDNIKYPNYNYLLHYLKNYILNNNFRNINILNCSEFTYKFLLDNQIISDTKYSYFLKKPDDFLKLKEYTFCGLIKKY